MRYRRAWGEGGSAKTIRSQPMGKYYCPGVSALLMVTQGPFEVVNPTHARKRRTAPVDAMQAEVSFLPSIMSI